MSMICWSKVILSSIILPTLKSRSQHYSDFEWSSIPASAISISLLVNFSTSWCLDGESRQIQKKFKLFKKWSRQGWLKKCSVWLRGLPSWTGSSQGQLKEVRPSSKLSNRQRIFIDRRSVKLYLMTKKKYLGIWP